MVARATNRKAVPVYEARGFRSGETVGALVALARNALWDEFGRKVEPLGLNATQAAVVIAHRRPRALGPHPSASDSP